MSCWTHVAGLVRVDSIRRLALFPSRAEQLFLHFLEGMPAGSEGPLTIKVYENPELGSLASYAVAIFGDLRDFEEAEYVEKWLQERCLALPAVRSGIATIEKEASSYSETKVWRWDTSQNEKI